MQAQSKSLTNLQLELLKAFSYELNDEDLKELKKLLADFFARKTIEEANKVWDEEKWDEEKVKELLKKKLRTPYKS